MSLSNQDLKKGLKKNYFTKTIEMNLAIALKKSEGKMHEREIASALQVDDVSAKRAITLLCKNKNAWRDGDGMIFLSNDLFMALKV